MLKFRKGTFQKSDYTKPPQTYYAIYLRKTDDLICSGTARECAEHLDMSKTSFHAMVCRVHKGITKKWDVYTEPYNENLE